MYVLFIIPLTIQKNSETTPLVPRENKRKSCFVLIATIFLVLLFADILIRLSWVPWARMTLSFERQRWEKELRNERMKEQRRIKLWEDELKAKQELERQREE